MASHFRAADIVAERLTNLEYRITLTAYTDYDNTSSGNGGGGQIQMDDPAIVYINGKAVNFPLINSVEISGTKNYRTLKHTYRLDYVFPVANWGYTISWVGVKRNHEVVNMITPDQQNIYVETYIYLNSFSPINSTPVLTVPPIDVANIGEIYTHNPGAWDPDGDSLVFVPLIPQGTADDQKTPMDVPGYMEPDDPFFGSPSSYTIDPVTGDIVWNTPLYIEKGVSGVRRDEYNIAFRVEEWRDGVMLGYVVRDMQIKVFEEDNERPELIIPNDTCIAAGELYIDTVLAWDPNGDAIELEAFGKPLVEGASFTQVSLSLDSLEGIFNWTPSCDQVQQQPQIVVYKVRERSGGNLSHLQSQQISVHGPAPVGLNAQVQTDQVQLTWDPYVCEGEAETISVWRATCDTSNIDRDPCTVGVPDAWGFEKIGEVDASTTSFLDNNEGEGLLAGVTYYYMLSSSFSFPSNGESYASWAAEAKMGVDVPLLKKVSVEKTDSLAGEILLEWQKPIVMNSTNGPFTYKVFRNEGLEFEEQAAVQIYSQNFNTLDDVSFVDTGLNTEDTSYVYQVRLFDASSQLLGSSAAVSSVWATSQGADEMAILNFEANVNWYFPDSLYQVVYRDSAGVQWPVDSVRGTLDSIAITGLNNGDTVCFFAETRGVFCNEDLTSDVLVNKSNITCTVPRDTVPPCPPNLALQVNDCSKPQEEASAIVNELSWENNRSEGCLPEEVSYKIYYKENLDSAFTLIATHTDTLDLTFTHTGLDSYAGCYVVTALDIYGNESVYSNVACNDNCVNIEFPNVFTPNEDQVNDLFFPIPPTRFVEAIEFTVYNRYGDKVYYSQTNPNIDWNGENFNGKELADGTYYYEAVVTFKRLNPNTATQHFNGWILLAR